MTMDGFADDLRQASVIARNEVEKFLRSRKMLLFGALMALVLVLITVLPYALGDGYSGSYQMALIFVSFATMIVELSGVLFTATSISSEYEERTALILFTRPVRKRSIYVGKLIASIAVVGLFALIYYLYLVVFSFACFGEIADGLWKSAGLTAVHVLAVTGLCMLMSAVFRKSSTASIMSIVFMMFLLSFITQLIATFSSIPTWWGFNESSSAIIYALGSFDMMGDPIVYSGAELWRSLYVMAGWAVATNIAAYFVFRRREFRRPGRILDAGSSIDGSSSLPISLRRI